MSTIPPELPGVGLEKSRRKTMRIFRIMLWILWGLLLFGPFSFACVIGLILTNPHAEPLDHEVNLAPLMFIDVLFGVTSIGVAHAVRAVVFNMVSKRGSWKGMVIWYPILKIACWFT